MSLPEQLEITTMGAVHIIATEIMQMIEQLGLLEDSEIEEAKWQAGAMHYQATETEITGEA